MERITVVGGGISGLVAAIACAEAGTPVLLREAHDRLGGRARVSDGEFVANQGPHVWYGDGPAWQWFTDRGLVSDAAKLRLRHIRALRVRRDGRLRAALPAPLVRMAAARRREAPVDVDFATWARAEFGERAAVLAARAMAVVTYDGDPGRLSAAFVWDRFRRVTAPKLPAVRYVPGGWETLSERLAARARELGVAISTGDRVEVLPAAPVIVATELSAARGLLDDPTLEWTSGRTTLLDLGLESRRGDPFAVLDLDDYGFLERFSAPDPTLAPPGCSLVQLQVPLRSGESHADGRARAESFVDDALPGWRDRLRWRRDAVATGRTGALDLPGTTWRDRPAVDRGDGVFLAGDMVAAPGLLAEVAVASALQAAAGALGAAAGRTKIAHSGRKAG